MKRLLTLLALALATATSFGATLNPIQLLNPAGSTAGQAIVSTGPSTAPAWSPVTATALAAQAANTVVANVTAASASPTAVALPSCSTANSALKYTTSTGFSCGTTYALTTGTLAQFAATTSAQLLGMISDETGTGSLVFGTSPMLTTPTISTPTIANGTMSGTAITNSPISGNAGSFTTLGATGALSGAGFTNYFASPPCIGCTAANTGAFTTLSASGLITPSSTVGIKGTATNDSAQAGSIGEYVSSTVGATGLTTSTVTNLTTISLTAGDWDVSGGVRFTPAGSTTVSVVAAAISLTSANLGGAGQGTQLAASFTTGQPQLIATPILRLSLSTTTTVYLVVNAGFGVSTLTADGIIRARRVR
jgi:hypothetical protein